jgi:hypothetical protein
VSKQCRHVQEIRLTVPALVYDELRLDVLEKLLSLQRDLMAAGKRKSICVVLDDCSYGNDFWRSAPVAELARNGRHSLCTREGGGLHVQDSVGHLVDLFEASPVVERRPASPVVERMPATLRCLHF